MLHKRVMDRLKKRRLRENPEFREKEKQEAKGRMRALRSDPTYRYYLQDSFNSTVVDSWTYPLQPFFFGWFKRSLNQSIGSFSANPHFALFRPDRRSDTFGNVSNHWGMVTYTFFWNNFFWSLIRARTGSFANVSGGTSPLYIKVGQISLLSKNGSWVLVDARRFFFVGHELEHAQEDLKNWWYRYMKVGQISGLSKNGAWVVVDFCISFFWGH